MGRDAAFFFEFKKDVAAHFEVLFDGEGEEPSEFALKWGYYPLLYFLSGENILKMEDVTKQGVKFVFSHLAFLKDLKNLKKNDNVS
jgi:hypothetical protein